MHPVHIARYLGVALIGIAALVAVALTDAALAIILVLVGFGLALVVLPFVVIHYDEHQERMRREGHLTHG
jgi:NADH:ubiquinone oxidoreductase subunit 6 (subunit J)